MAWPLIMLAQNICAAFYATYSRKLVTQYKDAHFQVLAYVFTILWIIFLIAAGLSHQEVVYRSLSLYWPNYLLGAVCFTTATVLNYIVFRYIDTAAGSLFSTLNIVSAVLIASLTIHETLSLIQLCGGAILLFSMQLILSSHAVRKKHNNLSRGFLISAIAAVFFGIAITNEKWLLNHNNLATYSVIGIGAQVLPLLLISLAVNRSSYKYFRSTKFIFDVSVMGLVRGLAGVLFVVSVIKANNVSLINVFSGLKVFIAALLGYWILKERTLIGRKIVASGLATVGVFLLLLHQ